MAWLVVEGVGGDLTEKTVALFGDNTPSISWISKLASKQSKVAEQLVQAIALRLKAKKACPLITSHIEGKKNDIADVPSRSFGSNKEWHCETNSQFLSLFNYHIYYNHRVKQVSPKGSEAVVNFYPFDSNILSLLNPLVEAVLMVVKSLKSGFFINLLQRRFISFNL